MTFGDYSKYYDLLYKEKDYKGETDYVLSLTKNHSTIEVNDIIDLGCGSGKHDSYFSNNFHVTGIDLSEQMINIA